MKLLDRILELYSLSDTVFVKTALGMCKAAFSNGYHFGEIKYSKEDGIQLPLKVWFREDMTHIDMWIPIGDVFVAVPGFENKMNCMDYYLFKFKSDIFEGVV